MTGIDNLIAPEGPYTRIGNQLLEALPLVKLNRTQENICIFLWRRTYGWNRTRDAISLTDFAAACGHCKEYVSKQIKALMRKRIIRRIFVPGRVSIYSFVADTAQWEKGCIDLEALVRNREAGIYCCANEELIDVTSDPEALWSDQAGEELDELCEGLMKTSEEMDCPIMEKGWLDGSEDMRENEINPADQRPAHITAPELNPRSSKESTSYISQELNFGTTQELNSNTTQELNSNTTQELNSNTTQELNSNTTQELNSDTTQELYSSTTPEQVAAPASPGTANPLKTDLKTELKT
ncbi:MAG TPA: replication protein, partial [Syntrophomonadaceae bacterium]|nr:replication protein [Syntrophomonadaceae bacterium]